MPRTHDTVSFISNVIDFILNVLDYDKKSGSQLLKNALWSLLQYFFPEMSLD